MNPRARFCAAAASAAVLLLTVLPSVAVRRLPGRPVDRCGDQLHRRPRPELHHRGRFGPDGSLYVAGITQAGLLDAEIWGDETPGAVWRIAGGVKTKVVDAPLPSDVAVGADGSIYVTVLSILPGAGQVWMIGG